MQCSEILATRRIICFVARAVQNQDAVFERIMFSFEALFNLYDVNGNNVVVSKGLQNDIYDLVSIATSNMSCLQVLRVAAMWQFTSATR